MTYAVFPGQATGLGLDQISVANVAALSALNLPLWTEGILAWVQSLRTYFHLARVTGAPAVDGITVASSANAGYVWERERTPNLSWTTSTQWYVNAATGNDENPPGFSFLPLRTVEEFFRRLPGLTASDYRVDVTGNVATLNGLPQVSLHSAGVRVKIKFAPTTALTGDVTAIQVPNPGGNNLPAQLQSGAVADWTAFLGMLLETTLPSNELSWTGVGSQTVLGTADTMPWCRVPASTAAGIWLPSGSTAAPGVGASIRVISLVGVTGTSIVLNGDSAVSYNIETAELVTVTSVAAQCKQLVFTACRFRDGGLASVFLRPNQCVLASGMYIGTAAQTASLGCQFMQIYGFGTQRTAVFAVGGSTGNLLGLTAFGAGITFGNTVSGPNSISFQTLASGSCTGIGVHNAAANANNNPNADGIVVRSGAWLGSTSSQVYGIQAQAGSVGLRVWGGGDFFQTPGSTPTITGAAKDFDIGFPSPATVMPPVYAAGAWPLPLAIPGGAGAAWALWNAASPAGFQRVCEYAGSSIIGCQ